MKIQFIKDQLTPKFLNELAKVVEDPQSLIPQTEEEFSDLQKFGLYPAEDCAPFVTKQGTPLYHLDNMVRIDSTESHNWLKDNLFQKRVDARKKTEYKVKFRGMERADWKEIQVVWMKYCLMLKYRCNALFRKDLYACSGKLPVEDATATRYASNLFWGAALVELEGEKYYFGCNVLGKLLVQLRANNGKLDYKLPEDLHVFGKPIIKDFGCRN